LDNECEYAKKRVGTPRNETQNQQDRTKTGRGQTNYSHGKRELKKERDNDYFGNISASTVRRSIQ